MREPVRFLLNDPRIDTAGISPQSTLPEYLSLAGDDGIPHPLQPAPDPRGRRH
ncbi:MAG: hypothetical protein KGJ99_11690 [Betaproteobacteria bacterium]|nr:hypothetical protein [Betaproteobacteria bacterium]